MQRGNISVTWLGAASFPSPNTPDKLVTDNSSGPFLFIAALTVPAFEQQRQTYTLYNLTLRVKLVFNCYSKLDRHQETQKLLILILKSIPNFMKTVASWFCPLPTWQLVHLWWKHQKSDWKLFSSFCVKCFPSNSSARKREIITSKEYYREWKVKCSGFCFVSLPDRQNQVIAKERSLNMMPPFCFSESCLYFAPLKQLNVFGF